jgi:hypothetical protein
MFRSVITMLIAITAVSSLQVAFFPRLPSATRPEVNLGKIPRIQAVLLDEIPRQQRKDWALSSTRRYSLRSIDNRQASAAVSLSLTGVAVRRAEHLHVALITQGDPNLEMNQRKLHLTTDGDEYAVGRIGGLEALQSCKAPSGRSGVSQQILAHLMPHHPFARQDLMGRLRRLAGLQSNRSYECVLMTLISSEKGQRDQLVDLWHKVLEASKDQPSNKT